MEAELPSRPYIALPDAWRSSAAAFMATAEYANSAELRTRPNVERKSIAGCSATVRPARTGNQFRRGKLFAVIAESRSYPSGPTQLFVQGSAPLLSMREVDSVEPLKLRLPVYDLTIEGEHEFFANGILVHNCEAGWCDEIASWRFPDAWDNFLFGLRLGKDPKAVITSTPKPIKLVRDIIGDPHTVVTRASSYENRANLAPAFFDSIIRKYEGTRIGRQELDAELLEDVPGALWTRALIDATRIRPGEVRWDLIVRIVVAIDPAVSSSATSDETGIVVVALTRSGHVVVLDDLSCRQSPLGWAKVAVAAYRSRQANMIVGEVNNGGDLVAMNVRAVDPLAAFRAVRASRGKYIRAEPVASLYEQGRVHHAGAFERLEDQMCGWTPQGSERSPDRMDALVWGVTELLIDPAPQTLRVPIGGDYQISPI